MVRRLLTGVGVALAVVACASSPSNPATTKSTVAVTAAPADFGHSWTEQDIKSSGATDAGQALRRLDPTLIISGR